MSNTMIFVDVAGDETAFGASEGYDHTDDDSPATGTTKITVGVGALKLGMTVDQWRTLAASVEHDIEAFPEKRRRVRAPRVRWAERKQAEQRVEVSA